MKARLSLSLPLSAHCIVSVIRFVLVQYQVSCKIGVLLVGTRTCGVYRSLRRIFYVAFALGKYIFLLLDWTFCNWFLCLLKLCIVCNTRQQRACLPH